MRMKKYKWIGPAHYVRFARKDKVYNIDTITDEQVGQLLAQEPKYWADKFQKVQAPKAKKQEKETDGKPSDS